MPKRKNMDSHESPFPDNSVKDFPVITIPAFEFPIPSILDITTGWGEQLRQSVEHLSRIPDLILQSSRELAESYQLIAARIQHSMEVIADTVRSIDNVLSEMNLDAEEIGPIFEEAGLWLSPGMNMDFWYEVRRLHKEGALTPPILQCLVIDLYHSDNYKGLKDIVSKWWSILEFLDKERFITHALEAHMSGKYTLSVPVLLIVAEGIMRDLCTNPPENPQTLINRTKDDFRDFLPESFMKAVHKKPFLDAFVNLYLKVTPGDFNRHDTVHARDLNYDTPINSLRLFLLLEMLHNLYDLMKLRNSN